MTRRWQDWATLILGVWLFLSPWLLRYAGLSPDAGWNAYIVGIAIVFFAVIALYVSQLWEEWINIVLGIWLIISPWVLGYADVSTTAAWNAIIVGTLITLFDAWAIVQVQREVTRAP